MKKTLVGAVLGAAVIMLSLSAQAQTKFESGLRLGYGIPIGKATGADAGKMSEYVAGQVPIWLDAGARLSPHLFVGGYGSLGFGITGDAFGGVCGDRVDCNITSFRLGAEVLYHLMPEAKLDPWFGGGIGYEWLRGRASGIGMDQTVTLRGFELLNLQGGADFHVTPKLGVGPFLGLSLGQYHRLSSTEIDYSKIEDQTVHEWLFLGVRGTFVL